MKKRHKLVLVGGCIAFLCLASITIAWDIPESQVIHRFGKNVFLSQCRLTEYGQLDAFPTLFQYVFTSGVEVEDTVDFVKQENKQYAENASEALATENAVSEGAVTAVVTDTQYGNTYFEDENKSENTTKKVSTGNIKENSQMVAQLKKGLNINYLLKNFYIVDSTTSVDKRIFDVKTLLNRDMSIHKDKNKKQILIYHTHAASESFVDSKKGKEEDTIVGVGSALTEILENKYGYGVIHDTTKYDVIGGTIDRNRAYAQSLKGVTKLLAEHKDIEVVIDLHRDGVAENTRTYSTVDGKKCAQVMLFNGLSRNQTGEIAYLHNPNLIDNLAFSLQIKIAGMESYPGLTKPVYLKGYRYNLHLAKRCLLIELGNQNNTVAEEKNTMPALANMIDSVLK